ncbi:mechanosensitive ion channel family protein [Noviherbaspirillum denitrificans]|uniref:Mechanosensitive ion channel protein MscS n=1 Tax=Noviherbaspirillum denitrificans TaxID=1968433 RepID=A0A254TG84_9BURK|nr:mechanosensitive ion channel domain-containing protein [Noviherbaspirillum denitrificans]OWW18688.1 mechanosensitive ion channel protein MscS [Noviherbaspirillum denitrificans]
MNERLPDWLETLSYAVLPWAFILHHIPWAGVGVQVLMALFAVMLFHRLGTAFLRRVTAPLPFSSKLVDYGHRAGGVVVFLLSTQVILRNVPATLPGLDFVLHANTLLLISALTWLGVRCVRAVAMTIVEMNPADAPDNLQARRIQTQTKVLSRSMIVLIVLVGGGSALMTLPGLKQLGTSLLASAGVAGLVVGFAAKPVLGNLLAGMQIALTQPIRLQDVVIVQNEWGHIEEITGTYVVVRIWDQRRLIVPLQWFIENPFQNWTRMSADILGTVSIWVDYSMPVPALRAEAERICGEAPEWDGRLCLTQVVDTNERAMHVRVLVSARDAGQAWDLRCRIREGLVDYVQRNHADHLPRFRAQVQPADRP